MCDVYIINIDRHLQDDEYERLVRLVSQKKATRLARFRRFEDSQRSLLGDVLARYAISLKSGIKNDDLVFEENEYGKPLLKEPCKVHFNISHSGSWVACALDDAPVGIDIEETGPADLRVAERFFSKTEYASLASMPPDLQQEHFYRIWTLKESYIKALGKGLSIPLGSFSITETSGGLQAVTENGPDSYRFFCLQPSKGVVCSVCTMSDRIGSMTSFDIDGFISAAAGHFRFI